MNLREPDSRLTRWRLKLSEYDFTVVYKKGRANSNADALSRVEIHAGELETITEEGEDTSSLMGNPSQTVVNRADSSTDTAHTSDVHPILEIPITDDPFNKFHREIQI